MGFHLVIQPLVGYRAEVVSPSPGIRQLVAGDDSSSILIQVPARVGGLVDAASFARSLAVAASEFGQWCEVQNRLRTALPSNSDQWRDADVNLPELGGLPTTNGEV
ncbi:MAG TPA: hypothetical protein VFX16_18670 [Pseudonocardiaceae bacterium]|nr:hypothetical protein [Pseudonocardiaceae bacterium]